MTHISAAAAEMLLLGGIDEVLLWGFKSRIRLRVPETSSPQAHTILIYRNSQIIRRTAAAGVQIYARMRRSGSAGESAIRSSLMVCGVIDKGRLGVSLSNLVWMHYGGYLWAAEATSLLPS